MEINFSNLLLSVVLKRLLAAHLVIYSPSVDFGDTVTRLLLSLGLSICAGLDFYRLQILTGQFISLDCLYSAMP